MIFYVRQRRRRLWRDYRCGSFLFRRLNNVFWRSRRRCGGPLPAIGDEVNGPKLGILTAEQIDDAMFG